MILAVLFFLGIEQEPYRPAPLLLCPIGQTRDWQQIGAWFNSHMWLVGDFDFDEDVDRDDAYWFAVCGGGPEVMPPETVTLDGIDYSIHCGFCNLDNDFDVDQKDFGLLQTRLR